MRQSNLSQNSYIVLGVIALIGVIGFMAAREALGFSLLASPINTATTETASGLEFITANGLSELSIVRGGAAQEGMVIKRLPSGLIGWAEDISATTEVTGEAVVRLDLGNTGAPFDSDAINLIATTGDTDSCFTEPEADKLLIDVGCTWAGNQPIGDYITALTGDVTATGPGSVTATIANDAVTFAKFQQITGFSVIGKFNTGTGTAAPIVASADQVLRRSGSGDLAFGTLVTNNLGDAQVTFAKIQNLDGFSILGKATTGGGAGGNITAGADSVLRRSASGDLAFGTLVTNHIGDSQVTYGKIQDVTADRVLGRITTTGAPQELTAAQVRTLLNVADGAAADQDLFHQIAVSGQDTVTASSATTGLTFAAGSNVTLTTNNTTKTITFTSTDNVGYDTIQYLGSALTQRATLNMTGSAVSCSDTGSITECNFTGAGEGGTPGGSNTQVQYNNNGAFGGISGATSNGTAITFANASLILAGSTSGTTALNAAAIAGTTTATLQATTGTLALLGNHLGEFAATTSAELAGVISDETGSGALVFASGPTLAGTITLTNAGAGADPSLASNAATQLLSLTGALEIINSGAGASPILSSNDAGQLLSLTGNLAVSGTLNTHTIPGGTGTLALTSDIPTSLDDLETPTDDTVLVGSGATWENKALTNCVGTTDAVTYATSGNAFGCNTFAAGRSLTFTASSIAANAELFTGMKNIVITSPVTGSHTNLVQFKYPVASTITRVSCSTDTGTVTIQLDERAEGTPNTAGTDVLSAGLVCDNDSQVTTSFGNAGIAANAPVNLQLTASSGTPGALRVHVEHTVDDSS